jgi:predicted metal-dependent phosphoesterase TrpH
MLKGALHVHSTYSDGEFDIEELRRVYLSEGCSFVCITDHAEYFDSDKIAAYARELKERSDEKFCFVMGLEYRCEQEMHILGYGARILTDTKDPQAVIRHITGQGAIAVIAHPKDQFFPWIEEFETLPQGIETWNSKYDSRYAPRPGTFALLQRLRERSPAMRAFYGQDLHWKKQFRGLFVTVECDAVEPTAILTALSAGAYCGRKDDLELPSTGLVSEELLVQFGNAHARSRRMWQFFKNGKAVLDRAGVRVPESWKAQLRRIF